MSEQGPVYLGYRLGHIKSDGRVFRALVYNKGAMVLHMLRRLVGDEAFFAGLRTFYDERRFKKAGTDDFRAAMEAASRTDRSSASSSAGSTASTFRRSGSAYRSDRQRGRASASSRRRTVVRRPGHGHAHLRGRRVGGRRGAVTDKVIERTIPLKGALRSVDVNRDGAALRRSQSRAADRDGNAAPTASGPLPYGR